MVGYALSALLFLPAAVLAQSLPEPPPGWRDARAAGDSPDILASLKGPETSSFLLKRVPRLDMDNRGVIRALLLDVLAAINRRTGQGFTVSGNVQATTFDNGLTAYHIRADLKGQPRLIIAVSEFGGTPMVAVLMSSVPETMFPSLLGSLKPAAAERAPAVGNSRAVSLDGQLLFALPAGLSSRALTEHEKKLGFVLALRGLSSELMVMKVVDEGTSAGQQPDIVKNTVLAAGGADPKTLSSLSLYATAPGPDIAYAWVVVRDPGGETRFAAGYLPWCYWGYSILAKGPKAPELVAAAFETLALGPSAMPRLVAKSPKIPGRRTLRMRKLSPLAMGVGGALVLGLLALAIGLSRRRSGGPSV